MVSAADDQRLIAESLETGSTPSKHAQASDSLNRRDLAVPNTVSVAEPRKGWPGPNHELSESPDGTTPLAGGSENAVARLRHLCHERHRLTNRACGLGCPRASSEDGEFGVLPD